MLTGNPMYPTEFFLSYFPDRQSLRCYFLLSLLSTSAPHGSQQIPSPPVSQETDSIKERSLLLTEHRLACFCPIPGSSLSCCFPFPLTCLLHHLRFPLTVSQQMLPPQGSCPASVFFLFSYIYTSLSTISLYLHLCLVQSH